MRVHAPGDVEAIPHRDQITRDDGWGLPGPELSGLLSFFYLIMKELFHFFQSPDGHVLQGLIDIRQLYDRIAHEASFLMGALWRGRQVSEEIFDGLDGVFTGFDVFD